MPKIASTLSEKLKASMNPSRRRINTADQKRRELREQFWPGSSKWIWDPNDRSVVGFATVPRLLPWVVHLINILVEGKGGDPGGAYLELWCRDWGQGIISISDEESCAYGAGYRSTRARRTWREHIQKLVDLGFIKTMAQGNREFAHVLLLNPLGVCARLKAEGKVPTEWWGAFVSRAAEISATISVPLQLPGMPGYVDPGP